MYFCSLDIFPQVNAYSRNTDILALLFSCVLFLVKPGAQDEASFYENLHWMLFARNLTFVIFQFEGTSPTGKCILRISSRAIGIVLLLLPYVLCWKIEHKARASIQNWCFHSWFWSCIYQGRSYLFLSKS